MVTPLFGWSAGDVVTSIHIIVKIYEAFKEAGGAISRYEESTAFLQSFKMTLSKLDAHSRRNRNPEYAAEISQQLKLIDAPYCRFEKFMLNFEPALGPTSSYGNMRKAPKKMKWALKELSVVSGKVAELKKEICDPLILVENIMQLHSLYVSSLSEHKTLLIDWFPRDVLQNIAEQISKLPECTQIEKMMDALKDAAANILIDIQSQIRDLTQLAQRHGKGLDRLADNLLIWKTGFSSEESEKNRQLRAVESLEFTKHVDSISTILKKLDTVTRVLGDQEQSHSKRLESLAENVKSQQLALDQVHHSVQTLTAKAEIFLSQKGARTECDDGSNSRMPWLSQFATQLVSSGITSAITGAVILLSGGSNSGQSNKSNEWSEPELGLFLRALTHFHS